MRGRKPKPTHLMLVPGRPGAASAGTQLRPKIPTCPAHLCPSAKAEWKRLARQLQELGLLTVLDRALLAGYCQAYGRWVEAEHKLEDTPTLLKLPSGYLQHNPWLTIAHKQLELMHKYMAEMGLSPVARTRLDIRRPGQASRFANLMRAQRPWCPADEFLSRR
jgi:P27 family predicted phage terminase small subunit